MKGRNQAVIGGIPITRADIRIFGLGIRTCNVILKGARLVASRVWLAINTNIHGRLTHTNETSTMDTTSSSPKAYRIAVIPGDGIGIEVIESGERLTQGLLCNAQTIISGLLVLQTLSRAGGSFGLDLTHFDWSSKKYKQTGAYMPDDFLDVLRPFDAIFFGAGVFPSAGM